MTATPNTKKPPRRVQPAEGVVPTSEAKNMTIIAETDDNDQPRPDGTWPDAPIEFVPTEKDPEENAAEMLTALIDGLDAGSSVGRTGFQWWKKIPDGTWIGPDGWQVTTAQVVAALADGGEVEIDEPARKVTLPATSRAPEVAAWDRLAAAAEPTLTTKIGEPDPFILGESRPAWADPDRWDGQVVGTANDYRWWRSKSVYIAFPTNSQSPLRNVVAWATFEVNVSQGAVDRSTWVEVNKDAGGGSKRLLNLRPRTARQLGEALLAAARLAEPDGEFDEAVHL
jgi:hypothetical protein